MVSIYSHQKERFVVDDQSFFLFCQRGHRKSFSGEGGERGDFLLDIISGGACACSTFVVVVKPSYVLLSFFPFCGNVQPLAVIGSRILQVVIPFSFRQSKWADIG